MTDKQSAMVKKLKGYAAQHPEFKEKIPVLCKKVAQLQKKQAQLLRKAAMLTVVKKANLTSAQCARLYSKLTKYAANGYDYVEQAAPGHSALYASDLRASGDRTAQYEQQLRERGLQRAQVQDQLDRLYATNPAAAEQATAFVNRHMSPNSGINIPPTQLLNMWLGTDNGASRMAAMDTAAAKKQKAQRRAEQAAKQKAIQTAQSQALMRRHLADIRSQSPAAAAHFENYIRQQHKLGVPPEQATRIWMDEHGGLEHFIKQDKQQARAARQATNRAQTAAQTSQTKQQDAQKLRAYSQYLANTASPAVAREFEATIRRAVMEQGKPVAQAMQEWLGPDGSREQRRIQEHAEYNQVRSQIANTRGPDAVANFDKAMSDAAARARMQAQYSGTDMDTALANARATAMNDMKAILNLNTPNSVGKPNVSLPAIAGADIMPPMQQNTGPLNWNPLLPDAQQSHIGALPEGMTPATATSTAARTSPYRTSVPKADYAAVDSALNSSTQPAIKSQNIPTIDSKPTPIAPSTRRMRMLPTSPANIAVTKQPSTLPLEDYSAQRPTYPVADILTTGTLQSPTLGVTRQPSQLPLNIR